MGIFILAILVLTDVTYTFKQILFVVCVYMRDSANIIMFKGVIFHHYIVMPAKPFLTKTKLSLQQSSVS